VIHQLEFQQLALGHQQPRQQVPRQQELVLQQLVQALQPLLQVQVPRQQELVLQQLVQALQLQVLLLLLLQQLSWQVLF
jgi:hypothetical protein